MELKALLKLNIYTDDTFTEVRKTLEVDKIKIPYRVAMYLISSLDSLESGSEDEILKFITANTDKLDKIVKATFGVSETELELIDGMELVNVVMELYKWAMAKMADMKKSKNVMATA